MNLISAESIRRPEVVRWHKRILERYTPPEGIGLSVLLPCSARKPYSRSKSHQTFRYHIRRGATKYYPFVHEVVLTSPLGIVPRELEDVYPAAHYDVPVTGFWSNEEKEIVIRLLKDYMKKTSTPIIAYVEGAYKEICEDMGVETTSGNPSNLETLVRQRVKNQEGVPHISNKIKRVRAVCDSQFGKGAWQLLLDTASNVKGFQVFDKMGELIATFDRDSGFLALTLRGATRLQLLGSYIVEISFKPETNSIFCVGIEKADPNIRPKDEVIVMYKGIVVGVGKAILSGFEMEKADKGLGITLRHRG
jgi:archaeosine synthase